MRDAVLSTAPSSRVTVISMGVDTERFHPSKRDDALRASIAGEDALLVFVGRLAEKKGVRYLIEAMPAILAHVPNCRLVIAGDGPLREDLEALSASLGLDGRVIFAGAKRPEDLPAYYASADVFVAPSVVVDSGDTESFGLVIAEAMASKCPVIASDVGGIGDLVKNGETGLLVPQRDSRAIANAVCEMLGNTQLRRRCSIAALRHVRDSASQRSVAGRYASLLREAIKPKQWAPVQQEGSHALEESSR